MKDPKNAKKMFKLAAKDFKALQNMADEALFDVEIFGFHAQQTVEKLLKAWLSSLGVKYERTHDLQNLFSLLRDN
ncbi:MAG TPA: DNA-binding protein, partial [Ignavibacteriales bacterium]|nr:DNA-binding protein [Ignavibacteriales bacterium]